VFLGGGRLAEARADFVEALGVCREIGFVENASYCFDGLSAILAEHGDLARAVRLIGAAQALRAPGGIVAELGGDIEQRVLDEARESLGQETAIELLATGGALSFEEAVALAFQDDALQLAKPAGSV
jgi:hypothetical protein